jgi:quinol monooxygenase YgiN
MNVSAPSPQRMLRLLLALTAFFFAHVTVAQTTPLQAGNAHMPSIGLWPSSTDRRQAAAPYVRIAQLEVDPRRLEEFKAALRENASMSVRVEPGVFTIYAVSLKENPNRFLVFEMYKDEATYSAHRETSHFRKFFESTREMVTSRTFLDVDPIVLEAKANWPHPDH